MFALERAMTRIAGHSGRESNVEIRCLLARPVDVTSNSGAMNGQTVGRGRGTLNIHTPQQALDL